MTICIKRRALLLAGMVGSLLAACSVAAQQQPPPWQQGRPEAASRSTLAPVAPPPIPTAADKLPLEALRLANGFRIEVYASGVANARTLRQGDKGTVFVSTRLLDKVYAIVEKSGKREVQVIAQGLHRPNGIALHNGTLYIAELSQISRIEKIEDNLDDPPKPTVIYSDLPKDEPHGWKFLTVGPDNKLYFQVGAPCNICMPSDAHAQIRRINLDGARDWLSEDVPEDKLNRWSEIGQHFGYPFCHQGNIADNEFGWGPLLRRVHQAGHLAGTAQCRARHAVLYRQHVPSRIQERNLHRAPRLLEPNQENRWRHRCGKAQRGWQPQVD